MVTMGTRRLLKVFIIIIIIIIIAGEGGGRRGRGEGSQARTYLSPEDPQCAADDDEGRGHDVDDEVTGDDGVADVTGRLLDDVVVHWLHPQTARQRQHSQ